MLFSQLAVGGFAATLPVPVQAGRSFFRFCGSACLALMGAALLLAPETLRLTMHEKPELGTEGRGFLMQLRGRRLSVQGFSTADGYGPPGVAELTADELRSLANDRTKLIILVLFFLSGTCTLVYEIVWVRMLVLVFGTSVYAVSTVLSAFMAGLALGSALFGRLVDRRGNPIEIATTERDLAWLAQI